MPTRVTPSLYVQKAPEAIEFYAKAFGAKESFRLVDPSGTVAHAQLTIGEATVMLSEENPEQHARGPKTLGGCSAVFEIHLGRGDVDALFDRAIRAGAKAVYPLRDQFYGERCGRVEDPFGHQWILSKTLEEVSPEEMQRRFDALIASAAEGEGGA